MQVRDRLLLVAEAEFAEKGPIDARLADIRSGVGVSVGALYHHFPDKSDLYRQVWLHALADYQTHFWDAVGECATAREGVEAGVVEHLRWVSEHPARAKVLASTKPAGAELAPSNREFFRNTMRWWRTHAGYGAVRALDFEIAYALWLGPAQEYSRLWLDGAVTATPTTVAATFADAAWKAVQA